MDDVQLGHNHLKSLNKSFLPMRRLRSLNLTHNQLEEFSFQEIRGLQNLKILDISYNKIKQLSGKMEVSRKILHIYCYSNVFSKFLFTEFGRTGNESRRT